MGNAKLFGRSRAETETLLSHRSARVAVVGFGYIGTVIGAVVADRGWNVVGIDVRSEVVTEINAGRTSVRDPELDAIVARVVDSGRLTATTNYAVVEDCDVIIMTVGTPLGPNFDPVVDDISEAARRVAEHLQDGHLVVLKSTVPPNTTQGLVQPILEEAGLRAGKDFGLAFCPERLAEGRAIRDLTSIPVVVGGVDPETSELCRQLWRHTLGVESMVVDSTVIAELTKLADNLWIDLNIALANELAKVCDRLDADVMQVIRAANTLPKVGSNVNILMPSMGVGGYCLTKDPWFVDHLGAQLGVELRIPRASRTVNDTMPGYTFDLLASELAAHGRAYGDSKVTVMGVAFKNNTGDCRLTPTKFLVELLERSGCELVVHDPWVSEEEFRTVTHVEPTASWRDAVKGADAVAFLTGHDEFRGINLEELKALTAAQCVFLDGRNAFDPDVVRAAGFTYKGVGR